MSIPTQPNRVECRGSLVLHISPDEAFPLFTARGERDWVPGWSPRFIAPPDGALEENQVFLTGSGSDEVIWSVVRLDRSAREIEYLRVSPGSRLARVSVSVGQQPDGCRVEVRYRWTALCDAAREDLAVFAAGYVKMLENWRDLIETHLAR